MLVVDCSESQLFAGTVLRNDVYVLVSVARRKRETVDCFAEAHDDLVRRDLSCFDGTHSPDDRGGDLFSSLRGTTRFREPGNVNKRHAKQKSRARALTQTCFNMRAVFAVNTMSECLGRVPKTQRCEQLINQVSRLSKQREKGALSSSPDFQR